MIEWHIDKNDFVGLLKKMALPIGSKSVFPIITLQFTHDGNMECNQQNDDITAFLCCEALDISGVDVPTNVSLASSEIPVFTKVFGRANSQFNIIIVDDVTERIKVLRKDNKGTRTLCIPRITTDSTYQQIVENGNPKMTASCDVSVIKELTKNNKKGEYRFLFDESSKRLEISTGNKTITEKTNIKGNGTVHCSIGLYEVMNVLRGEINISIFDEHLCIEQKSDKVHVSYSIKSLNGI